MEYHNSILLVFEKYVYALCTDSTSQLILLTSDLIPLDVSKIKSSVNKPYIIIRKKNIIFVTFTFGIHTAVMTGWFFLGLTAWKTKTGSTVFISIPKIPM